MLIVHLKQLVSPVRRVGVKAGWNEIILRTWWTPMSAFPSSKIFAANLNRQWKIILSPIYNAVYDDLLIYRNVEKWL